jgi:hypothetical protein
MGRILPLLILLAPGCTTFHVRQSSLVPAATPAPPPSFDRRADLYVGDTTVVYIDEPELAPNSDAGLWIPRHQFDGALALRFNRWWGMRVIYRHGLNTGATPAAPTTMERPAGDVWGAGFGVFARAPLGEELELQFETDVMTMSIPSFVIVTDLEAGGSTSNDEREAEPIIAAAFGLSWRPSHEFRLWVDVGVQNHPTNIREFDSATPEGEVDMGPANLVASVGTEVHLSEGFSVIPQIQLPVTAAPVRYGPILGIGLRGELGSAL